MNGAVLIIFWAIQTGVGYWIGHNKGRPLLGTALGFFLGVLGWIIMAFVKPTYGELVRRERVRNAVTQAAADSKPGVYVAGPLTREQALSMTERERRAYVKDGVRPARFMEYHPWDEMG